MENNDEDRTATAGDEVDTDASNPEPASAADNGAANNGAADNGAADTAAPARTGAAAPAAGGEDEPEVTFADMGLAPAVAQAVRDVGYEVPSAIQAATIPLVLEGRDVVGLAQTGTGKTAAFALPILSLIDPAVKSPQALILAPTRELALQVAEACVTYSANMPQVNVLPIYGGQAYGI